jgi:serine/tyrosine/threonine adenylyltransferase
MTTSSSASSSATSSTPAVATPAALHLPFDNSYARDLEGLYAHCHSAGSPAPRLLCINTDLADTLGLDAAALASPAGVAVWAGNAVPELAHPLAQAYAGHQFGQFSPQLGDGRAVLLGELIDRHGQRRDMVLKGSGRTPFSRGGDGLSALGPVLREYLMGEAMHALGIPTTRALAAIATGATVQRNGPLPGGMLTRIAASHVRVGTFEYFAARGDLARLRRLADYAIARHATALQGTPTPYLGFLQWVLERQAALIAAWMGAGFIHGVMNTDNMGIAGETLDYGPCAFLEHYNPATVFSSIDTQGRYAYGRQPGMAHWNLARLAQSLLPLIDTDEDRAFELASEAMDSFAEHFQTHWQRTLFAKLGFPDGQLDDNLNDRLHNNAPLQALANDYLQLLQTHHLDFTLGFRKLADAVQGQVSDDFWGPAAPDLAAWLQRWHAITPPQTVAQRVTRLRQVNPIYIPRNHQVEAALTAAVAHGDMGPFQRLLGVLQNPYEERTHDAAYAQSAPTELTAGYRTFCGT